jgi:hypothetical protein
MNTNTGQKNKIMKYTAYCGNKTDYAACIKKFSTFCGSPKRNEMYF